MENSIKLATWNLCLGLSYKKDCVSQIIKANKVDICCMQDIDIPANYNHDEWMNEWMKVYILLSKCILL